MADGRPAPRHLTEPRQAAEMPMGPGGIAWYVLLGVWTLLIWVHSMMPGDASASESGILLTLLMPVFDLVGIEDIELAHLIVRKLGHFSEYLVLGLIATRALRPHLSGAAGRLAAFCAIWVTVPSIDETIQMFSPGRGPAVTDVLIDMAGFATGSLIASAVITAFERRNGVRT